jgi:hypothetical protein
MENSVGMKEVIARLPVGLKEEITTKYSGKSENSTVKTPTAWRHRLFLSQFIIGTHPILLIF